MADESDRLLCRPDDADALADAFARLLRDCDLRARLVANGRAKARVQDWPAVATPHLDLYREIIAEARQ